MLLQMRGEKEGHRLRAEHFRFFEGEHGFLPNDRHVEGGSGDVLGGESHAVGGVERRRELLGRHIEPVGDAGEGDLEPGLSPRRSSSRCPGRGSGGGIRP